MSKEAKTFLTWGKSFPSVYVSATYISHVFELGNIYLLNNFASLAKPYYKRTLIWHAYIEMWSVSINFTFSFTMLMSKSL